MEVSKKKGLNANQLKLIAIAAMTVDHVTSAIWPGYRTEPWILLLHIIGRITAPIMWFFVAEGFHYTRDWRKYALRLLLFAVISHFAYNFAFGIPFIPFQTSVFNQTSVIWTLFWGLILLVVANSEKLSRPPWLPYVLMALICAVSFCADWSCIGALAIFAIGVNRGNFKRQMLAMMAFVAMYAAVYFFFIDRVYGLLQLFVALSIPLLSCYNGQRGSWKGMKWLFYVYYPAHLVLCGLLRIALHGGGVS